MPEQKTPVPEKAEAASPPSASTPDGPRSGSAQGKATVRLGGSYVEWNVNDSLTITQIPVELDANTIAQLEHWAEKADIPIVIERVEG